MRPNRVLIQKSLLGLLLFFCGSEYAMAQEKGPYFASGIKIGEVTENSAIVWVRLTEKQSADFDRLPILTEGLETGKRSRLEMPDDIVPGAPGRIRLVYWTAKESEAVTLPATTVGKRDDFVHQFRLSGLQPGSTYHVRVESLRSDSDQVLNSYEGRFKTAYAADQSMPVKFIVSTCQAVRSIDAGKDGHQTYRQMLQVEPDFFVHTGDILYYDKVPFCKNAAQARSKWHLMFAYGNNREFFRNTASYFMKDDHDTLKNDCWPGQKYGELTFEQGLKIFREQVPMGEKTYRTIRWGKDIQIWLTENRDFRSSNRMPDGPEKTILGGEQKAWLFETIEKSDATFKFIISPGPLVGPDKRGKADNHSNAAFHHQGQQLRDFLSKKENTYVICGDRHWQYCSRDPDTGLVEFGCGPINDEHKFGGHPGKQPKFHRYFGSRGGFLLVTIDGSKGKAEWVSSSLVDDDGNPSVAHTEILPIAADEK